MFDQSAVKWFNQVLFIYADTKLNSNGTIKLNLSVNSKEGFGSFSPPSLLLSISNQLSKSLSLRIEHLYDIVETFEIIYKMYTNNDPNIYGVEFERAYGKNTSLILKAMKKVDSGEVIFRLMLQSGLNDLTFIDFRFRIFQAIYKIFTNFTDSYTNICFGLLNKYIDAHTLEPIKEIPITLKSILSNLNSIKVSGSIASSAPIEKIYTTIDKTNIDKTNIDKTDKDMSELNEFLGRDMTNIKVPGIDILKPKEPILDMNGAIEYIPDIMRTKEHTIDIKSKFVSNVLNKDLYNFQKFLTSIKDNSNSLESIIEFIKGGYPEGVDFLPGIKESDYNSAIYISEVIWKSIILLHKNKSKQIPYGTHAIFYKAEQIQTVNSDLALDLLMLMSYIKVLRIRMEDRTPDYIENFSMFYTQFRYLMAILCFSFIRNQDPLKVSSIVASRFKDYNKIGFFNHYNSKLESFNCQPITETDILKVHNDFFEKFLNIQKDVIDLHEDLYKNGNLNIPPNSEFNREQIINEIIPLQVLKHTGEDLNLFKSKFSEKLFLLFNVKKEESPQEVQKPKEEKSNIIRYVEANKDKAPEKELRFLIKMLHKLKNKNFNFTNKDLSYIEFEDEIIKALHVWKPEDDPKLINNYGHFLKCCEECILTKQQILSLSEKVEDSAWSNIDAFLRK